MTEKLEHAADRLGITPDEHARLIDEQRAAITRRTAVLDFPPGYEPGSHLLRLPEKGAMRSDESDVALWVKPGQKGRPAVVGPLQRAVQAEEKRRFDETGNSLKAQSARRAAKAAAEVHKAKGDKTREKVEALAADGKRPDVIAKHAGLNKKSGARRVNQILAASKNKKSP